MFKIDKAMIRHSITSDMLNSSSPVFINQTYFTSESGEIAKLKLININLLFEAPPDLINLCPQSNRLKFTRCIGNYSNILVLKSDLRFNSTNFKDDVAIISNSSDIVKKNYDLDLFAIHNVFVNYIGNVFNSSHYFTHGGCADSSWSSYDFNYTFPPTHVLMFNHTVLSIIQPYENSFGHEILEVYSYLLLIRPILRMYPNITILASAKLGSEKMKPLLTSFGINHTNLNIVVLNDNPEILIHAPIVITPTLHNSCVMIEPVVFIEMRKHFAQYFQSEWKISAGNDIIISDRYLDVYRKIITGDELVTEMISAFPSRNIVRFFGNESLLETISMFRKAEYFVATHGSAMINMMFMHTAMTVVEIHAVNFNLPSFEHLSQLMNISHHHFICGKGRYKGNIPLKVPQFIGVFRDIVQSRSLQRVR